MTTFKVGDIVMATVTIWRKDRKSVLNAGDKATVTQVWQTTPDSPQIIGVGIAGKMPMGDIVCYEDGPFVIAKDGAECKQGEKKMTDSPLINRFNAHLDQLEFSHHEWKGLQINPKLALLAGMAIGYKMAVEDVQRGMEKRDVPERVDLVNEFFPGQPRK